MHTQLDRKRLGPCLAELNSIRKSYSSQGKPERPVLALDQFNLQLHAGETVALLGANGAGKTTAIAILTGLQRADQGSARLFGQDPQQPAARAQLGVMLQECELPDLLTVRELLALFSSFYDAPMDIPANLTLCGLEALQERRYGELSGGQKRRVQFSLALCGNPKLLLVDEPTVGLDSEARQQFWAVLRALKKTGVALLLTTHYLEEADQLADRVVLMHAGQVIANASPQSLKQQLHAPKKQIRFQSTSTLSTLQQIIPELSAESRQRAGNLESHGSGTAEDEPHEHTFAFEHAAPESALAALFGGGHHVRELSISAPKLEDAVLALSQRAAQLSEAARSNS